MPYIVKRVEVPLTNIQKTEFSPIEYSCQNLQTQIDRIEGALARQEFVELQPLLQGSLLTQVNEGPKKIAEIFLGRGEEGDATEAGRKEALRAVFRQFLDINTKAVASHHEFAQRMPIYLELQEKLGGGLSHLTSALQPYLK
jgi:hypothetical protein